MSKCEQVKASKAESGKDECEQAEDMQVEGSEGKQAENGEDIQELSGLRISRETFVYLCHDKGARNDTENEKVCISGNESC